MDMDKAIGLFFAFVLILLFGGVMFTSYTEGQRKTECIVALKDKSAAEIYTVCHK